MDEGWNDVKYREITCILNLAKSRTKNRNFDLPLSFSQYLFPATHLTLSMAEMDPGFLRSKFLGY